MTVALLWDVDGTLLTTARAGIFSLEDALEQVSGVRADLQEARTAGLTDWAIAETALRSVGDPAADETVRELLRVHAEQLPGYLDRRRGAVLPGIREALESLSARGDVVNLLLTGNVEAGAHAKLRHYDLDRYFTAGGAFCVGPGDRAEIARAALTLADGATPYVIGDTPADVACGKAIGARTIAVATGAFTTAELVAVEPWQVLERIPDPAAFEALLGLAENAAA